MKLLRTIHTFFWFVYIRRRCKLFDSSYWSYKRAWKFAKEVENEYQKT
jgi:hypothetical protein